MVLVMYNDVMVACVSAKVVHKLDLFKQNYTFNLTSRPATYLHPPIKRATHDSYTPHYTPSELVLSLD
jgi:hypothetical protein